MPLPHLRMVELRQAHSLPVTLRPNFDGCFDHHSPPLTSLAVQSRANKFILSAQSASQTLPHSTPSRPAHLPCPTCCLPSHPRPGSRFFSRRFPWLCRQVS